LREALAERRGKVALEAAKALAKAAPGAETDALLFDAYIARAEELARTGFRAESLELLGFVKTRFPAGAATVDRLSPTVEAAAGDIDALLRRLADPALTDDRRAPLLQLLGKSVRDPADVAESKALPRDHPIRIEASRVAALLERVAREPIDPRDQAFTSLPRRSPFLPFVLLARAIDAAFRGNVAEVDRIVGRIPSDTAPARLAASLSAIASRRMPDHLTEADRRLVTAVLGIEHGLSRDLVRLEQMIEEEDDRRAARLVEEVAARIRTTAPALFPEFRRLLTTAWFGLDLPLELISRIIDPAGRDHSEYCRVMALAFEDEQNPGEAVKVWDSWLVERGRAAAPEEIGAIRARQALLAGMEGAFDRLEFLRDLVDELRPEDFLEALQEMRPPPGPDPAHYMQLALQAVPSARNFRAFHEMLVARGRRDEARAVAERWSEAFPDDVDAVLARSRAEENLGHRDAALALLDRAAGLAPHDPRIREALTASLLGEVRSSLRAGDRVRARAQLARFEGPAAPADEDLRLVLGAARWFAAEAPEQPAALDALSRALGDPGARYLLNSVSTLFDDGRLTFRLPPRSPPGEPAVASRSLAIARRAAVVLSTRLRPDQPYASALAAAFRHGFVPEDRDILPLADLFVEWGFLDGLSHLARLGLGRPSSQRHRFLYYRGMSLTRTRSNARRREECLAAAIELARRVGDDRTVRDAEARLESYGGGPGAVDAESVLAREAGSAPEEVRKTQRRERNPKQGRLF
jgi:tetratricopeptide (TPR) repeat protein